MCNPSQFYYRNIAILFLIWVFSPLVWAGEATSAPSFVPEQPKGRIILTIMGKISRSNSAEGAFHFDLNMLEKLPQKIIYTTTRWTDGIQEFQGVLLVDLLQYVGATGTMLEAIALDNYVSPPTSIQDFKNYSVIAAIKKNGKYIKIRDKGPIWMTYPIDDYPELKEDLLTQYKLIWHLRTLIVK